MKEVISKYLQLPSMRMYFDAVKAERDGEGNVISSHYAKIAALQRVIDDLQKEAAKLKDVANIVANQGGSIVNATEIATEGAKKADVANSMAEAAEAATAQNLSQITAIIQQLANVEAQIKDLEGKAFAVYSDYKGVYLTEASLRTKCAKPKPGDSAAVAEAFYLTGGSFNPAAFYGDAYIGDKAEHKQAWSSNTKSVNHLIYSSAGTLYEIVEPTTLQYIADEEHNADAEMVAEGIIIEVTPKELKPGDSAELYLYLADEGGWYNTQLKREEAASTIVEAYNVLDNGVTQQRINDVNQVNALTANINLENISKTLNALAYNFNELLPKLVLTGEVKTQPVSSVSIAALSADNDDTHKYLDISVLPIILE